MSQLISWIAFLCLVVIVSIMILCSIAGLVWSLFGRMSLMVCLILIECWLMLMFDVKDCKDYPLCPRSCPVNEICVFYIDPDVVSFRDVDKISKLPK